MTRALDALRLVAGLVLLIAAAWIYFTVPAQASTVVGLHLHSVHLPSKPHHSDENLGVYLRAERWQVGAYKNTYSRPTVYVGYVHPVGPLDLTVGLATGYQRKCGGATCDGFARAALTPTAALGWTAPVQGMGLSPRITVVPGFKSSTVVHLSVERALP